MVQEYGCSISSCLNILWCRAYDRAAVKFRGLEADINFVISDYEEDLKQVLTKMSKM